MWWNLLQTVDRGLCHSPIPLRGKDADVSPFETRRVSKNTQHSKEAGKGGVFFAPHYSPAKDCCLSSRDSESNDISSQTPKASHSSARTCKGRQARCQHCNPSPHCLSSQTCRPASWGRLHWEA